MAIDAVSTSGLRDRIDQVVLVVLVPLFSVLLQVSIEVFAETEGDHLPSIC